jgi:hypothetical protein
MHDKSSGIASGMLHLVNEKLYACPIASSRPYNESYMSFFFFPITAFGFHVNFRELMVTLTKGAELIPKQVHDVVETFVQTVSKKHSSPFRDRDIAEIDA